MSVPLGIIHYIPVTLTNNQSVATPSPFQQMVVINNSEYATFEAANLQNVEFFYSNGTVIPSWLEDGRSNNSTGSTYWLKIANGIPAYSSITIYMGFSSISTNLFNSQTTGEAPLLSSPENRLVGYWKFDEGAGNVTLDSSGNGYEGILKNSPTWVDGKYRVALSFDGINNWVELPQDLIKSTVPISISAWFRTSSNGVIIGVQDTGYPTPPGNHVPIIYVGTDGKLRGEIWTGESEPITTTFAVNDGNWHHVVLAANITTQNLFLDGNLIGTLSGTISELNMAVNYVGLSGWNGWSSTSGTWGFFNGTIDEVQILNKALSRDQASQPQIPFGVASSIYGKFDNGAIVFNFYDNFAGTTLGSKWINNSANSTNTLLVHNGITIQKANVKKNLLVVYSTNTFSQGVIDFYGVIPTGGQRGSYTFAIIGLESPSTTNYGEAAVGDLNSVYGLVTTGTPGSGNSVTGLSFGACSLYSILVPSASPTGISAEVNYGSAVVSTSSLPILPQPIGFQNQVNTGIALGPIHWVRTRAYPPNGMMPSVTVGFSVTFAETGLLPGTPWSVTLADVGRFSSTNDKIIFLVPSGVYDYRVGALNYAFNPSFGSLSVDSSMSLAVSAHFDWFAGVSLKQLLLSAFLLACLSSFFIVAGTVRRGKRSNP